MATISTINDNPLTVDSLVTPEQFGAKGDGTTDDSAAFAAAFASGKPLFCRSGATYMLHNVNMGYAHDVTVIGNGCEFKNNKLDISDMDVSALRASTSLMFYSGEVDSTLVIGRNRPNITFEDCTIDIRADEFTAVPSSFPNANGYGISLVYPNIVTFRNVTVMNSWETAFAVYLAKDGLFEDCSFENISVASNVPEGSTRNVFEWDTVIRFEHGEYPRFTARNCKVKNVHDEFGRFDTSEYINISGCRFEDLGAYIVEIHNETHAEQQPSKRNVVISDCCGSGIGGLVISNNVAGQTLDFNISNCSFDGITDSVGSFCCGTVHISDSSFANADEWHASGRAYGLVRVDGGATAYISSTVLDASIRPNADNYCPVCTAEGNTAAYVDGCTLVAPTSGNNRAVYSFAASRTSPFDLYISDCTVDGNITGAFGDLVIDGCEVASSNTVISAADVTRACRITANYIETSTGSVYMRLATTTQPNSLVFSDNLLILTNSNKTGYMPIVGGTSYFKLSGNTSNIANNLNEAFAIPSGCIAAIYDNNMKIKYSGTAQIAHDNVGVTITA